MESPTENSIAQYRLTEYSHGAGCGCKLSPGVLAEVLGEHTQDFFPKLLVGNETKDDAAVVDLDGKTAIVSTTDFFMPIVDDAHDFGAIAATNAISDIYAMGAMPLVAIAILGWPIDKIPTAEARKVLEGARSICHQAKIPLAGGHSIDAPEPIFGLAVTGKVPVAQVKKNKDARPGDLLFLTKPLGVGILATAQKRKLAEEKDLAIGRKSMLTLNSVGAALSALAGVHAITDVTGFGLAGHLLEVCQASNCSAVLYRNQIPVFDFVRKYLEKDCIPGGTKRNWQTYGHQVELPDPDFFKIIADPQTSGGLLVSVSESMKYKFEELLTMRNAPFFQVGHLETNKESSEIWIKCV